MQSRLLWAHMTAKLGNTNTTLEGEKSKHVEVDLKGGRISVTDNKLSS